MRVIRLTLVVVTLLARTAQASDAEFESARIHSQAGIAYYNEARYEEAAREMEAAYRLKPLAELQYNLAQCYERLGRTDDAVAAYQRYLDGKRDAPDRELVLTRIQNLHARASGPAGAAAPSHEK